LSRGPLAVGVRPLRPAKETPAIVVAAVVPVETTARPSTPMSVALSR
jgi:hypothetical protein